ncbi:MAG: succinate dehydrogenase cytochrome b subunit [Bacteroidales bacterium]
MSNFFLSSIGKKFLMSITGLFLILFLMVHLGVNSLIVFDSSGELFNRGAHFMATNPAIIVIEPILAIGLILHIVVASIITLQNQRKREVNYTGFGRYQKRDASAASSWPSRNMYILGTLILVFLIIHLINFFWKMKVSGDPALEEVTGLGGDVENAYALVTGLFIGWKWSVLIYVIGALALGLHLYHGVWSAFQSLGWSNRKWRHILSIIGVIVSIIFAGGFAFIPVFVLIQSMV